MVAVHVNHVGMNSLATGRAICSAQSIHLKIGTNQQKQYKMAKLQRRIGAAACNDPQDARVRS